LGIQKCNNKNMENEIIIKPKFIINDYFKVSLFLFVTSRAFLFLTIADLLFVGYFTYYHYIGFYSFSDLMLIWFIAMVFWPALILLSMYVKTKRILADPRLKEDISFTFNNTMLVDSGQNYSRTFFWSELLQIKETKNFFLIYITKYMVKVIRKVDLKENQYEDLKELFSSLPIKKSLK